MFFSPCLEIEAYFFVASNLGWTGIIKVSMIYTIITISGMLLLVWLEIKEVKKQISFSRTSRKNNYRYSADCCRNCRILYLTVNN